MPADWGGRERGWIKKGQEEIWGVMIMFIILISESFTVLCMYMHICEYVKTQVVHFKYVQLTVCPLYFSKAV